MTIAKINQQLPLYLQDLNPAQLEAVCYVSGPLLIFAGAGSGKTRVLTRRIAHLIFEHNIAADQIFAVTFTNKAANEMKGRVASLFNKSSLPLWVSTFHASCARILRRHAKHLDFTPNFAIYDTADTESAMKRVYKKLNIDPKTLDPRMVRSRIDKAKNEYQDAEAIRRDRYLPEKYALMIAEVFESYQEELRQSNAMDFGDLICNTVTLFKLEPLILQSYQEQFQHIMVDEYQDTNKVQYMLIRVLAEKTHNLCVVGDDDQSIYAFRGATVENILNFKKDFPEAHVVTLDTNYRSTKSILHAANSIIAHNKKRQKKTMKTPNPSGRAIASFQAYDEKEEASFVCQEITAMLRQGFKLSDIAVFYRTNAQSRAIEEGLCQNSIPYEIYGGHRFYDRKEINDLLAYYRLLLNPDDNESFLRIINTPTRGLGATAVGALVAYAGEQKLSLFKALEQGISSNAYFFSSSSKSRFVDFVDIIKLLQEDVITAIENLAAEEQEQAYTSKITAIAHLLKQIAEKTDYLKRLKAEDTLEAQSRIENIFELFSVATDFVSTMMQQNMSPTLGAFLDRTSLSSDLDSENTKASEENDRNKKRTKETISLMTLHLAKGLEFEIVFLVGLEEGLLPHIRSLDDPSGLEEERRLCYVGITRARKHLYLSRAITRQSYGRGNWLSGKASRFLDDLPSSVLEERRR